MATLEEKLLALATMSPAQLRAEWRQLYRQEAPALTAGLLRHGIAYRLQEKGCGRLAPAFRRELEALGQSIDRTMPVQIAAAKIKPGTRLVRDWGGESHHVLVEEKGFHYRDRRYTSLTSIAAEITGTRWSGPRFFGLKQKERVRG